MGGCKHNKTEGSCNFLCSDSVTIIDQNLENFWKLE